MKNLFQKIKSFFIKDKSKKDTKDIPITYRNMFVFYFPIVILATSQAISYPLVASIVSHGTLGTMEYTAFAQAHALMFLIGSIGGGLISTGMVFAKNKYGMREFHKLSVMLCIVSCIIQLLCSIPPLDKLIFSNILKLEPQCIRVGANTLLLSIAMQFCFFYRNTHVAILYNNKKSGRATAATMLRIVLTAFFSVLFVKFNITGYFWGSVAMIIPVAIESYLLIKMAKPYIRELTDTEFSEKVPMKKQLLFTIPLSFAGVLLSCSNFLIVLLLSKSIDKELAKLIYLVAAGIAKPLGFAALRFQSVLLAFPTKSNAEKKKIFKFALISGTVLSTFLFILYIGPIAQWYFGTLQNLKPSEVPLAKEALLILILLPILQSVRAHAEGTAMIKRKPNAILAGNSIYLVTITLSILLFLYSGIIPCYLIGVIALILAVFAAFITIRIGLLYTEFDDNYSSPNVRKHSNKSMNSI